MARKKKKRAPAARAKDVAEHVEAQPMKTLQEVDFYTLWNMCKKSPDYDVKAWVAAEAKLSRAFDINLLGDAGETDGAPVEDHDDPSPEAGA